jgi:hypothetical protein
VQAYSPSGSLGRERARLGPLVDANSTGTVLLNVDTDRLGSLWAAGPSLYVQFWHEDVIGQGIGFSNAVELPLR